MSQYPHHWPTLFRGETVQWPDISWDFIPAWMLITTPPVAPLLAALGIGQLARLCADRWRDAFANSTARFGLLAVGCLTLPVVAAVALNSNLYSGWRHMYFLYAPICVLAAFGLRSLGDIPKPSFRAAAFALAALGIALAVVQMVRIHPYQNDYFNALVDKTDLVDRWDMGYWHLSRKEALETVIEIQPTGLIAVAGDGGLRTNMWIIPEDERRRLRINPIFPSFGVTAHSVGNPDRRDFAIWKREIYGVPIYIVVDRRAESKAAHRAAYAAARASQADASWDRP